MISEVLRFHKENTYEVTVGRNCLSAVLPGLTSSYSSVFVISDYNVLPLWKDYVTENIKGNCFFFSDGSGETIKDSGHLCEIWNFLSENGADRHSLVIALGGGTVGDLAGFAAATYMRGIDFVQLPTSLLAMTDSSVGGKNGIDIPTAKNAVGTIRRPKAVICDTRFLDSLPENEIRNGMAEVIKYAFIGDNGLLSLLDAGTGSYEQIICRCLGIKKTLVETDEQDIAQRRYLNFGHTAGHAIEKLSGFTLPHGLCVAYGCETVLRACAVRGFCDAGLAKHFADLAVKYSERIEPGFSAEQISRELIHDKKADSGYINFVVLSDAGKPGILRLSSKEAEKFIKDGICR